MDRKRRQEKLQAYVRSKIKRFRSTYGSAAINENSSSSSSSSEDDNNVNAAFLPVASETAAAEPLPQGWAGDHANDRYMNISLIVIVK